MNAIDKDTGLGAHNFKVKAVREILEEEEWKDMALAGLRSACSSDSIRALQFALEEARTASVSLRDIAHARECLKTLVHRLLQDAIERRDRDKLVDALDSANAAGLGYDDPTVCAATAVLEEELRRKKAVEGLHVACSAKDPDALQLALGEARCASVSSSDMAEAEAAFEPFARQRLQDAMGRREQKAFQVALVSATAAGLPDDDSEVQACFQMMKRTEKALEELLAACPAESVSPSQLPQAIERLQLALEEAIQASLRQSYIDDAQDDLQALEAQLRAESGEARARLQDATKSRGKQGRGSNGIRCIQMRETQVFQPVFMVSVVGCSLKT